MCQSFGLPPIQIICCYRAQVLLVLLLASLQQIPGQPGCLWCCHTSQQSRYSLLQPMGLTPAFQLMFMLKEGLHLQLKLLPRTMPRECSCKNIKPFTSGHSHLTVCVSHPDMKSQRVCQIKFVGCHSMESGLRHGISLNHIPCTGIKVSSASYLHGYKSSDIQGSLLCASCLQRLR